VAGSTSPDRRHDISLITPDVAHSERRGRRLRPPRNRVVPPPQRKTGRFLSCVSAHSTFHAWRLALPRPADERLCRREAIYHCLFPETDTSWCCGSYSRLARLELHLHSLDQISVLVRRRRMKGREPGKRRPWTRAGAACGAYGIPRSLSRTSHKQAQTPFSQYRRCADAAQRAALTGGARCCRLHQLSTTRRARAWRLVLEPGQSADPITQKHLLAHVIDGGEIAECRG